MRRSFGQFWKRIRKGRQMSLWERLSLPWRACVEESWAAYRAGSYPIGAVITDADGAIVARGRNRVFETAGELTPREAGHLLFGTRLAHAEINALLALDTDTHLPQTCVLYSAAEPCPLCAGAIRMTRLRAVRYASFDPPAGSIALFTASPWMGKHSMQIEPPADLTFQDVLIALRVERVLRLSGGANYVADELQAVAPQGARLGAQLAVSGELQHHAAQGAGAEQAVRFLESLLGAARLGP